MTDTTRRDDDARRTVLGAIRGALGVTGNERDRRDAVAAHLQRRARHVQPERTKGTPAERVHRFRDMLEAQGAVVEQIDGIGDVPTKLAEYLRGKNLPLRVRHGADPLWQTLPWDRETALVRKTGAASGSDAVGLSHAMAGVAETGTLVLTSGADNPTTINFLPESHVVVLAASDIVGGYEDAWDRIRARQGNTALPRAVNFVTGPSRTADIEQQLVMGAHGPRRMLVLLVGQS